MLNTYNFMHEIPLSIYHLFLVANLDSSDVLDLFYCMIAAHSHMKIMFVIRLIQVTFIKTVNTSDEFTLVCSRDLQS